MMGTLYLTKKYDISFPGNLVSADVQLILCHGSVSKFGYQMNANYEPGGGYLGRFSLRWGCMHHGSSRYQDGHSPLRPSFLLGHPHCTCKASMYLCRVDHQSSTCRCRRPWCVVLSPFQTWLHSEPCICMAWVHGRAGHEDGNIARHLDLSLAVAILGARGMEATVRTRV